MSTASEKRAQAAQDKLLEAALSVLRESGPLSSVAIAGRLKADSSEIYRLLCKHHGVRALPDQGTLTIWTV